MSSFIEKLIPQDIKKKIPPLYATEEQKDPIVYVKLFLPQSNWTWYITEMFSDGKLCFGYVVSPYGSELGYFSLEELSFIQSNLGLFVERDLLFKPIKLSDIKRITR